MRRSGIWRAYEIVLDGCVIRDADRSRSIEIKTRNLKNRGAAIQFVNQA
jgi:hypothetical protein